MPRVIFSINSYNHGEQLKGCLESLRRLSPEWPNGKFKVVVVDGAYPDFLKAAKMYRLGCDPHDYPDAARGLEIPWSTDGSLEAARSFADVVIEARAPLEEPEKRSLYLSYGHEGDYHFVIDADEVLMGALDPGELVHDNYFVRGTHAASGAENTWFRVHRHFPGMRYIGFHNGLFAGGVLQNKAHEWTKLKTAWLEHKDCPRCGGVPPGCYRCRIKQIYYQKFMTPQEQAFRNRLNF